MVLLSYSQQAASCIQSEIVLLVQAKDHLGVGTQSSHNRVAGEVECLRNHDARSDCGISDHSERLRCLTDGYLAHRH